MLLDPFLRVPAMVVDLSPAEIRTLIGALQARTEILTSKLKEVGTGSQGWRAVREYIQTDAALGARLVVVLRDMLAQTQAKP
jgi:hypothetical protein